MSAESAGYRDAESAGYRDAESAGYRDGVVLSNDEERELYVILKPRESALESHLHGLLRRIEKSLFGRLTIEEIERLAERFAPER